MNIVVSHKGTHISIHEYLSIVKKRKIGRYLKGLPLEILIYIAKYNEHVWYLLYLADDRVKTYTHNGGFKEFRLLFTQIQITQFDTTYRILNKLHRDNDLPAIIYANGTQWWYQRGVYHRDNDLPAIIYSDTA